MANFYEYFAAKENHPTAESVALQEEEVKNKDIKDIEALMNSMFEYAKKTYTKPIGVRIIKDGKIIGQKLSEGMGEENLAWLSRKEKVVNKTHRSSYWVFLDSLTHHIYDDMINDEDYAVVGGSMPYIINDKFRGMITCTGLSPEEDHDVVYRSLSKI